MTKQLDESGYSIHGSGANFDSAGFDRHMSNLKSRQGETEVAKTLRQLKARDEYDALVKAHSAKKAKETTDKLITDPFHPSQGVNIKTEDTLEMNKQLDETFKHDVDHIPGQVHRKLSDLPGHKESKFTVVTNPIGSHTRHSVTVSATSKNHANNLAAAHFTKQGLKNGEHFDGLKVTTESTEQLDELNKKTLKSYIKRAAKDKEDTLEKGYGVLHTDRSDKNDELEKLSTHLDKRSDGIDTAKRKLKEEVEEIDETHKLNDTVIMSYPSLKGVKGKIGEIRHAAYKGGPKTYTIDYQHPKHSAQHTSSIQLSSSQFKAHKEGTLGEETLDEAFKTPERATYEKVEAHGKKTLKAEKLAKTDPTPENKQSAKDHRVHLRKLEALRNKQIKSGELKSFYSPMHGGHITEEMVEEMDQKSADKIYDRMKTATPHQPKTEYDRKIEKYLKKKHAKANEEVEEIDEAADEAKAVKVGHDNYSVSYRGKSIQCSKREVPHYKQKLKQWHQERITNNAPKKVAEEVESVDELSMDTVKSYKEKVSKNPAPSRTTSDILHKAIRRFAGKERAEDRIHHDEMVKMRARLGIKEETLEELDQSTLASYKKKASFDVRSANATIGSFDKSPEQKDAAAKVRAKRSKGLFASVRKMAKSNESVETLDEGKFIETHKGEDSHGEPKPNPRHPAYATHKKAYDAKVAERKASTFSLKNHSARSKAPEENPVKMHHIDSAISNSFPDVEPYEHLKRQFPHLHKQDGRTGSKLTDWANKTVAAHTKNKHKTLSSYTDAAYKDMHDDKMMGESFPVPGKIAHKVHYVNKTTGMKKAAIIHAKSPEHAKSEFAKTHSYADVKSAEVFNESDTSKESFNYAEWKANKVKPRKPAGHKDAEALNNQQKKVDAERKLKEEVEEIDEGTTHYSAKNGSNTYHLAVTKDGASVTNQHGVALHASSVYGKAGGHEAAETVHNTVVKNLRRGTKSGKDTAENALKKFSHFNWESQNSTNEETLDESAADKEAKIKQLRQDYKDKVRWSEESHNPSEKRQHRFGADKIKNHLKNQYKVDITEESLGEAKTHEVRLEYGHQEGDSATYKVKAKDSADAKKKAISLHRKSWPYHSEGMLASNAYVSKLDEEFDTLLVLDEDYKENNAKNLKIIRDHHKKLLADGFTYKGSESKDKPFDDVEITHNYENSRGNKHSMSYSAYAPGWDKDIVIKHSAVKATKPKLHSHLQEEVLDEAAPSHKVGDTVWATSPTNKALTMTGKVTKVGATLTTVKHKDGSEAHYPHKLVDNDYEVLHPNPYKKFQREHLEQTGELLTLSEVKYMVENANGGAGAIAQHGGIDGQAPANTGKAKKMMGNKASIDAIVKIIAKGAKPN